MDVTGGYDPEKKQEVPRVIAIGNDDGCVNLFRYPAYKANPMDVSDYEFKSNTGTYSTEKALTSTVIRCGHIHCM